MPLPGHKWTPTQRKNFLATAAKKKKERKAAMKNGNPTPSERKQRKVSKVSPDALRLALLLESLINASIMRQLTKAFNG